MFYCWGPFVPHWIGSHLAYNFVTKLHKIAHLELKEKKILLVQGEIDCRYHIPNQMKIQCIEAEDVIHDCIDHYWVAVEFLQQEGYEVCIAGPVASTILGPDETGDYPRIGDNFTRNKITSIFNHDLKNMCKKNGVRFTTLFHDLVSPNTLKTKEEYYAQDKVHVGQQLRPLVMDRILKDLGEPCPK